MGIWCTTICISKVIENNLVIALYTISDITVEKLISFYINIFYALYYFSGKSPFLDDSDEETKTNILRCDYSFPNEYFSNVSSAAKELIQRCLLTCLLYTSPSPRDS